VLIEVAFANITFVETQFRASGRGPFEPELPMIPGNGVGGVVSAVGEGADTGLIGRLVVTSTGGSGGYAQRVAVEASALFEVSEGLALDAAVALLADGRTATGLVRAAAIKPGERVLVEAAAGGVGSLLVQLAKAAGAEVIGAVGGARKAELVRELGADLAVDYREHVDCLRQRQRVSDPDRDRDPHKPWFYSDRAEVQSSVTHAQGQVAEWRAWLNRGIRTRC
jgi:NADPH2:quinone reductase